MTKTMGSSMALVSQRDEVFDGLLRRNNSGLDIDVFSDVSQLTRFDKHKFSVVVYDMHIVDNNVSLAKKQIITIKKEDPTRIIIVLGDKRPLLELLKMGIQPIVYRAFSDPLTYSQIVLCLVSATKSNLNLKQREESGENLIVSVYDDSVSLVEVPKIKNKSFNYLSIALISFVLIGGVLIMVIQANEPKTLSSKTVSINTSVESNSKSIEQSAQNEVLSELSVLASKAESEGRLLMPKKDSALAYYNKMIEIDPYDTNAYEGRKRIINHLERNIPESIAQNEYVIAQEHIRILSGLDPLNKNSTLLSDQLSFTVKARIKKMQMLDNKKKVEELNEVLKSLGETFVESKVALNERQQKQKILLDIDQAISMVNFDLEAQNYAMNLLVDARNNKTISAINVIDRFKVLSLRLFGQANKAIDLQDIDQAKKLLKTLKVLDVHKKNITALEKSIADSQQSNVDVAAIEKKGIDDQKSDFVNSDDKPGLVIMEAKLVERTAPIYPDRAIDRNIEGWVEMSYTVIETGKVTNIEVIDSLPKVIFNRAAVVALSKWTYEAAFNTQTGQAISSDLRVRLSFKLKD